MSTYRKAPQGFKERLALKADAINLKTVEGKGSRFL